MGGVTLQRSRGAAAAALQRFAAAEEARLRALGEVPGPVTAVEFELRRRVEAEAKAEANAARLSDAEARDGTGVCGRHFVGRIKSYNVIEGFGFIQSPDIQRIFGRDAFFNVAVEGGIVVGGKVSFTVKLGKDNKPQAYALTLEDHGPTAGVGGTINTVNGVVISGQVYRGRVKTFNANRGFGFIICPELQNAFGKRDIYVAKSQAPEGLRLTVGTVVNFALHVDRSGRPQARNLVDPSSPQLDSVQQGTAPAGGGAAAAASGSLPDGALLQAAS